MAVSYKKSLKLFVDTKMQNADLRQAIGILPNTITRMNEYEEVTPTVLGRICRELYCDCGGIISFVPDVEQMKV